MFEKKEDDWKFAKDVASDYSMTDSFSTVFQSQIYTHYTQNQVEKEHGNSLDFILA